jgi:hypothetical protein
MHRFNAFVFAVVVWSGAVAPGCARFDIPEGTPIACSADDDCPTDYACRIDRCLPVTSESVPPAVSSATVNTATVGVAGEVTVALVANETLALAPVLSLVTADRRRAFTVVLDDDGLHADAQLTVSRDDLSGAAQIVATLVDLAGNQANDVLVGTSTRAARPLAPTTTASATTTR